MLVILTTPYQLMLCEVLTLILHDPLIVSPIITIVIVEYNFHLNETGGDVKIQFQSLKLNICDIS